MDERSTPSQPKLGIVISMFPELHETFILRELVALERRGVEFEIFSLQYPRDPITLEDARRLSKERTHYSPLFNWATLSALLRTLIRHPLRVLRATMQVAINGRDRPLEVVKNLAILPLTLHFGELGRQRGVIHWHGHWANIPTTACWYLQQIHHQRWSAAIHGEDIFSKNRFLRVKLDDARFCVVCSDYFCNHLKHKIGLRSPDKVHLNYHGLDPRVLERAPDRRFRRREADDALALVSIGRLVPTKGHDVLINACARLIADGRKVSLRLIGSGPIEQELRQLALEKGVTEEVIFLGALSFSDVLKTLEQADMFCLAPRLIPGQPPDGIPNVIAEAMALRVPVVTTRVSAIPELVTDGLTGRLVPVDDVDAFTEAVAQLADSPALAQELSERAAVRVAQMFNQKQNIDDLLALFEAHVSALPIHESTSR